MYTPATPSCLSTYIYLGHPTCVVLAERHKSLSGVTTTMAGASSMASPHPSDAEKG